MSDYFEVREITKEIIRQAKDALDGRRFDDGVQILADILNYPQEFVEMERYRDAYELLVKIIKDSEGSVALDVLPLIIAGRLLEDPLIDMNIGIAVTELEKTQAAADPNLFQNTRDRIIQWLIDNTEEFARVSLQNLAEELNVPIDLLQRILKDAIFDGYIIGKLDLEKGDLIVLPAEAEKRQLKCIICYQDIDFDAPDLVRCRYCGTVAHYDHIQQWVAAAGKKCPRCMSELKLD